VALPPSKTFDGSLVIELEGKPSTIDDGLHAKGLLVVMIDDRGHQPFPAGFQPNPMSAHPAPSAVDDRWS